MIDIWTGVAQDPGPPCIRLQTDGADRSGSEWHLDTPRRLAGRSELPRGHRASSRSSSILDSRQFPRLDVPPAGGSDCLPQTVVRVYCGGSLIWAESWPLSTFRGHRVSQTPKSRRGEASPEGAALTKETD